MRRIGFAVALTQGEIQRRLVEMRGGDGGRLLHAIGLDPALPQPVGQADGAGKIAIAGAGLAKEISLAGDSPQHRVDQALEAGLAATLGDQVDHGIDGGMGGGLQEQALGDTEAQDVADGNGAGRQRLFQTLRQAVIDLAEMAQGGGDEGADELPVAAGQLAKIGMGRQSLVQRAALAQHRIQEIQGGGAGRNHRRRRARLGGGIRLFGQLLIQLRVR